MLLWQSSWIYNGVWWYSLQIVLRFFRGDKNVLVFFLKEYSNHELSFWPLSTVKLKSLIEGSTR